MFADRHSQSCQSSQCGGGAMAMPIPCHGPCHGVAGHFVPCSLRNLPLRTTKNNRPTSSYHLYLPVRTTSTYHFVPTTSYLPLYTYHFVPLFLNVLYREMESIRNLTIITVDIIITITILNIYFLNSDSIFTLVIPLFYSYQFGEPTCI